MVNKKNSPVDDDKYEFLPQGTPGRKSFMYFPKQKKHFWRPEALALRKAFILALPFFALFIAVNLVFFQLEILALLFDLTFLWLSFYNYMTLHKITTIAQLILLILAFLLSLSHI